MFPNIQFVPWKVLIFVEGGIYKLGFQYRKVIGRKLHMEPEGIVLCTYGTVGHRSVGLLIYKVNAVALMSLIERDLGDI